MTSAVPPGDLAGSLAALRGRVAALRLELTTPGAEAARSIRDEVTGQVDDYLLPRLRRLDAPLLAVVGGSTGAGKSTLVNTLVGAEVTRAGWLRPTTRGPVLVCNPADRSWFAEGRVLPDLSRTTGDAGPAGGPGTGPGSGAGSGSGSGAGRGSRGTLALVAHDGVPRGLALLDAPDIDSVVAENRRLAGQLLAAADLWIFATSAARYADAVPWELLHTAQRRSTALAVVLNRVPPEGIRDIGGHLSSMLDENGLSRAVLFTVPEVPLSREDELLPGAAVAPLRAWLARLAEDSGTRSEVIRTTLDGALASLRQRVSAVAREVDDQLAVAAVLRDEAEDRYAEAVRQVDDGVRGGSVLRGEVLARWQEFVGTGEFSRGLEERVGRIRDRVTSFLTGRGRDAAPVEEALESSVATLVRAAADGAAELTVDGWRVRPAGRALLAGRPPMAHSGAGFRAALENELRAWQGEVLRLVAEEGREKRTMARLASFGTNGAGLVLMLAVFAQTGGLSGAEILVAGGTSAASQKVLEAVFGDSAVRMLATRARAGLMERVEALLAAERERFTALVDAASPEPGSGVALRASLDGFEDARRAARELTRPGAAARGAGVAP